MTGGRSMTTGEPRQPPDGGQNIGWTIFGYLISGMFVYGGLGWVIRHWTGHPLIFPLGMLAGLTFSVWLVIYRYGRS